MARLCRMMQYLTKVSLAGLILLLLYLTWYPQQRKAVIERSILVINGRDSIAATVDESLFRARQQKLNEDCLGVNLTEIKSPHTIIYSKKLSLAYCPVPAAASTQLKYAIALSENKKIHSHLLYNVSYQQAIHSDTQKLALRSSPDKINGQVDTLLVVRDPWQRLISVFRKFVEHETDLSSYTKRCRKSFGRNLKIDFEKFLRCVIEMSENGGKLVPHLQPLSQLCSLCRIHYNRIVRFENISPELKVLFALKDEKPEYDTFVTSFHDCPVKQMPQYNIMPYLTSVTKATRDQIQKLYKMDFKTFGYPFLEDLS